MTNADPRLCSQCGAAREVNACTQMAERHCRDCHLGLHGEPPRRDSGASSVAVEHCRDCASPVTWYAPDGTAFCDEHGKVPAV